MQVPTLLKTNRQERLAFLWLFQNASKRKVYGKKFNFFLYKNFQRFIKKKIKPKCKNAISIYKKNFGFLLINSNVIKWGSLRNLHFSSFSKNLAFEVILASRK